MVYLGPGDNKGEQSISVTGEMLRLCIGSTRTTFISSFLRVALLHVSSYVIYFWFPCRIYKIK
jgi:hypothetical protein